MSLEERIYKKLQESSLAGSICIDLGDKKITVDANGEKLSDISDIDCTLILSEETLIGLVDGEIDSMSAYFAGDIKIQGDIAVAMSLSQVLKQ